MYVCICHAVTDREIKRQAESGVRTMRELRRATGCSGSCGQCAREAKSLLELTVIEAQRPGREPVPSRESDRGGDGYFSPSFA